ncbi:MAG: trypsin-like peptidase domain-containing protein [Richelia sp. RM2_1_2]|nr:trypsin-like peptidase domain-containing protein [Richelia sp. RM2_1_2]
MKNILFVGAFLLMTSAVFAGWEDLVSKVEGHSQVAATSQSATSQPAIEKDKIPNYLQDISVTIRSVNSEGSGVVVTRQIEGKNVNFVWTAGHVVASAREERSVIDPLSGTSKIIVEFKDVSIIKELVEDGRRVGEIKMTASVIRYSEADNGEDLALLRICKTDFIKSSAVFYLDKEIPSIGKELFHVGSLKGQFGSNSLTTGVVSQIGRILNKKEFDQTTATAFPGSSGGGVFLQSDARYVGMLVRGAGETFNLIVPIRRMQSWARSANIEWAIDTSIPMSSEKELEKLPIEEVGASFGAKPSVKSTVDDGSKNTKFMIRTVDDSK